MLRHLIFALLTSAILSCGQNEPLADFEPKSPQEQALKNILLEFQDGVNDRNYDKIRHLIHEEALLITGRDRKSASKAEYIKTLPKRLAENPPIALGKPKIKVLDDIAEVKIYMTCGNYNGLVVFNMKQDNNTWYIQSWRY